MEGVVVSVRPVTVSDSDRLGGNAAGIAAGAGTGLVVGSTIGNGKGAGFAALGGTIIGATVGSIGQDLLSTSDGMEYIVRINRQNIGSAKTGKKAFNTATENAATTELISVVQGKDKIFTFGQKVYILYTDDRPRMTERD